MLAPPPPSACSNDGGRGATRDRFLPPSCSRSSLSPNTRYNSAPLPSSFFSTQKYFCQLTIFLFLSLISSCNAKEIFTNHFYVKINPNHGVSQPSVLAHNIQEEWFPQPRPCPWL